MVKFLYISTLLIGYIALIQCAPIDPLKGGAGGKAGAGTDIANGLVGAHGHAEGHAGGELNTSPTLSGKAGGHAQGSGGVSLINGLVKADGEARGGLGGSFGPQ